MKSKVMHYSYPRGDIMSDRHKEQIPEAQETKNRVRIANEYWEVIHDREKGGCPVSLVFHHGSGKNFLNGPLSGHLAGKEGNQPGMWRRGEVVFSWQHCRPAEILKVLPGNEQGVTVCLEGVLCHEDGRPSPVRYSQTYEYKAWGQVNVSLTYDIPSPLEGVMEIGACNFFVIPEADVLGVRPGCPPPPPPGYYCEAESNLAWYELTEQRSYRQQYSFQTNLIPSYFCLCAKGVEGFEFWREDDGSSWDRPFGMSPGHAAFLDDSRKAPGCKHIRLEPYCNWSEDLPVIGPGRITFRYTLGLPFVKERGNARKCIFHAAIYSRDWPAEERIKAWADNGVSIIRLHDDYSWIKPSWRDGYYPPYDKRNMKRMDKTIELSHKYNMKIVPYFSLKEFHPDCPNYPAHAHQWKRWVDEDGRIPAEKGPFGGYMCMRSGWLEFRKQSIDLVLKNHSFDGVYYDHLWFRYCRHPEHLNGCWHTDAEEILEFLVWTRRRVGNDGIVFVHTSGCPTMIGENLSDLVFIGEDMSFARPLPGAHPPDMEFVPIAPRNWVPAGKHWSANAPEFRESVGAQFLEHCPPDILPEHKGAHINAVILEYLEIFKRYDLNSLDFHPAHEALVTTDHRDIHVALYAGRDKVILLCVNLSSRRQKTRLRISSKALKHSGKNKVEVITRQGKDPAIQRSILSSEGISVGLPPGPACIILTPLFQN